jgi:hypothetical protein
MRIYNLPAEGERTAYITLQVPNYEHLAPHDSFYHEAIFGRLRSVYRQLRGAHWNGQEMVEGLDPYRARRAIFDIIFSMSLVKGTEYNVIET